MQTQKTRILIISGPSGVGKTSVVAELCKDPNYRRAISFTTRTPRPNETDGIDYHFLSVEKFEAMKNDFLEYAVVSGNYYGTPKVKDDKYIHIFPIDPQGAFNVKRIYPHAKTIFLLPPSKEELQKRLMQRNQDSKDVIAKRMAEFEQFMEAARLYEYQIVNADLATTVQTIQNLSLLL